jgi:hypothetical protein
MGYNCRPHKLRGVLPKALKLVAPQTHIQSYHYNNACNKPCIKYNITNGNVIVNKSKVEHYASSRVYA